MNILVLDHISKTIGNKELFCDVSLGVEDDDKIGIIGINGSGKSTLLRMIAGTIEPDEGSITRRRDLRTAILPQTPEFSENISLLDYVMGRDPLSGRGMFTELDTLHVEDSDGRTMLTKLGFSDPEMSAGSLSGGEKKRVALARALLTPADLLILDEPTNHLDGSMVRWLEDYLRSYKGALIMVTHDRYFLDRVTNRIVEIDHGSLYTYETNYSGYLEMRQERIDTSLTADHKRANILRNELAWLHRGARARSTKQKAHIQRIDDLQNTKNTVLDKTAVIDSVASRMGKKTIEIEKISKAYDGRVLFEDFSYIILRGERIGIVGPNGCGKSTLMKIITGLIPPDTGKVEIGETIRIGYFAQENEDMNDDIRVIDYIRNIAEIIRTAQGTATASQMLERFLFPPALQYTPVNKLSGGEKRRLYLLRILMTAPNVLILDEPTNDLDIATLETLEDYLESFDGIVVTVSHDRFFLDRMANRIFAFEGTSISQYEGGWTDYYDSPRRPELAESIGRGSSIFAQGSGGSSSASDGSQDTARPADPNAGRKHEKKLRFSYKEQREYETIDEDIAALEEKIAALDAEMAEKASQYSKLQELMALKEQAEAELEEKTERWVYLNELAEQIEAVRS